MTTDIFQIVRLGDELGPLGADMQKTLQTLYPDYALRADDAGPPTFSLAGRTEADIEQELDGVLPDWREKYAIRPAEKG